MNVGRQRLRVGGVVQGVGFRPFVYRLACELGLVGWVRNDAAGVTIEAQGETEHLAELVRRLRSDAPPLARVERIDTEGLVPGTETAFEIRLTHGGGAGEAAIGPDTCVCAACLAEAFDPANRRYRYPFINCTDCGPRYTLVRHLPYERAATSMSAFPQCPACLTEYQDPAHRRFHAEPNACPVCGPQLTLLDAAQRPVPGDALANTLARLRAGQIVAIKGLGGFHLACDADHPGAVARLRARKDREAKPLALMFAGAASLEGLVEPDAAALALLQGGERPIVLMRKTPRADARFADIAPGLAWLGVMLPYTPLHYLLFHEAAGRPQGLDWLASAQALALVMTSANRRGEPLVTENAQALEALDGLADAWLMHDRAIVTRCDDSVMRVVEGRPQFLRRARGHTPRAIRLARPGPSVLALGGFYKNTLCLTRGDQAFLSHHIGDLDRVSVCLEQEAAAAHLQHLLQTTPERLAHDLHPDFHGTRFAQQLAERQGLPAIAVQHHHAHVAAVLAEHGVEGPVLGLALDGVGLGTDGKPWGGELLQVDGAALVRLGHLRELPLPGGDRAAREPWRMAAGALSLLGRGEEIAERFAGCAGAERIGALIARQGAVTSSLGRWFDAAAGLLGLMTHMDFEGQAAMRLEGLAERHGPVVTAPLYACGTDGVLDLLPLLRRLADEGDPAFGAALFHAALAEALIDWVSLAVDRTGLRRVACGGGCLLNAVLARRVRAGLVARGIDMLEAQAAPPGDGGLALGQAWVAQRYED